MDDRRPEKFCVWVVEGFEPRICSARAAPFVKVLGVANFEILKAFKFGVATLVELIFLDRLGEPFSETFIGDCGRLAGDRSGEIGAGALRSVDFEVGGGNLTGDRCR